MFHGLIDCSESTMTRYLDLQSFILRSRALKLYRQALRTARRAPIHARGQAFFSLLVFPSSFIKKKLQHFEFGGVYR